MKKILCLTCLLSFLNICIPVFAIDEPLQKINVPANTSIFIRPTALVTSKDNSVENINAEITNDVIINGKVIFKAGNRANLHISEMEKARCWGKGGKLTVTNGYAYDVNGNKHKILFSKNYYGNDKNWTKACGVVSIFFLWPLALIGFVHGEQAKVTENSEIETNLASQFDF